MSKRVRDIGSFFLQPEAARSRTQQRSGIGQDRAVRNLQASECRIPHQAINWTTAPRQDAFAPPTAVITVRGRLLPPWSRSGSACRMSKATSASELQTVMTPEFMVRRTQGFCCRSACG
jgi:hypothetical protein